jgi:hypothetical protein
VEKAKRLFLPCFAIILLGLIISEPTLGFDGHDGGFDDTWDGHDDAGDDGDKGGEDSHAGHDGAEGQGHHERDGHHHTHQNIDGRTDERHHGKGHHHTHAWPVWGPGWGFAPTFGGFGVAGFGLGGFGGPGFGAFGYGPPYYHPAFYDYRSMYYSPVIVPSASPPVYVQRQNAVQSSTGTQSGYWHYCREREGYYPQVQECPDGWEQVAPQAQDDNRK